MRRIRILVDSFADEDGFNAQMTSARDIMSRLDPARFQVSTFTIGKPDPGWSSGPQLASSNCLSVARPLEF